MARCRPGVLSPRFQVRIAAGRLILDTSWIFFLFFAIADVAASVEVHFEDKDGGFFLKHSPRQFYPTSQRSETVSPTSSPTVQGSVLSVDKFTVFQTSEPASIRATYGPFSTKQTVPARYIVPDPLDVLPTSTDPKKNYSSTMSPGGGTLLDAQELGARHLDMSAHLVSTSIPRDSPVLRVLFHAGSEATGRRQLLLGRHQRVCVVLHATLTGSPTGNTGRFGTFSSPGESSSSSSSSGGLVGNGPLTAACSPDGQDGVCLAQISIPASWWPPLPPPDTAGRVKPVKTLPRIVQLAYTVLEPKNVDEAHSHDGSSIAFCQPRVQIQPLTPLGQVTLAPNRATYKELKTDEYLTLLVPHGPLYPRSRLHIPAFLQSHSQKQGTQGKPPVATVILRARVKAGIKILDASSSSPDWTVDTEINSKNTVATFTARRKENVSRLPNASAEEIMTMLLEASEETTESKEHGSRIVWSVRYALEGEEDNVSLAAPFPSGQHHHHHSGSERKKLQAHLEIQKDDIQAVLPISKNWEVMNTAVLTARQVSQAMKVFIVSQAGTVADVTLQSSCHSEDESVLKVSSSCSSVYVDGSEIRGSSNASVLVKYGTYTGLARFTVWMPEFPLEVSVTDSRLNQIKGWKVPEEYFVTKNKRSLNVSDTTAPTLQKRSATIPDEEEGVEYEDEDEEEEGEDLGEGKMRFRSGDKWDDINSIDRSSTSTSCRLRFQQSPVEVHARFFAADHDSGRVSFFVNRRTWLRVTDLVAGLLRVSDPRIATLLQDRVVQGRGIGRTEVQVLSPITGRVIGAKEVRVGNDRVSVSRLSVKVVSGLQLTISPDSAIENGYVAETSVTRKLTAQYQEGLLDIDIEFSDGSRTPLRDIAVSDYHLQVVSFDPGVVAFAPMVASPHPRVIAVGEGRGDLLRVTLQLADICKNSGRRAKSTSTRSTPALPLATALANVEVDFVLSDVPSRPEFVQNDGGGTLGVGAHHRDKKPGRDYSSDVHDILIGRGGVGIRPNRPRMSPLEIAMYVLLAAFCFAIVVFVVSCVVYASKFKPQPSDSLQGLPVLGAARAAASQFGPNRRPRESTTNAHDWVWLGRATLERAACAPQQVRVTSNPLAGEQDDETVNLGTSFDNPHHVELPSSGRPTPSAPIDTTTYCKRDRLNRTFAGKANNQVISKALSSSVPTAPLRNDNDNVPPPLPPHKNRTTSLTSAPTSNSSNQKDSAASDPNNGNEEYKPPVPPHRNSGAMSRLPDTPRKRHRRSASSGEHVHSRRHENGKQQQHHHRGNKATRSKNSTSNPEAPRDASNNEVAFIEVRSKDDGRFANKSARSREVKRATIVGNPMFSSSSSSASSCSSTQEHEEPAALDDLNLGMDYNQIMQYFDNLKESNA